MNTPSKLILSFSIAVILTSCSGKTNNRKIGSYKDSKNSLKGVALEEADPVADVDELEREVNNGGFNQYFYNSSGQNCFETLRALKKNGKVKTAEILESAIHVINPNNISETDLIERLRSRELKELDDTIVNKKLDSLNQLFYKNPDGSLK